MSRIRTKVQANRKTRYYPLTRINGKETPLGGFRTKIDAVNVLKKAESEIAKGVFMVEMKKDPLFTEWVESWLASKQKSLKPSTYASYESAFRTHISPFFERKRLSQIDNEAVDEWV